MSHCLIIGITGSGKTTLAAKMATRMQAAGRLVLIFDPFSNSKWTSPYVYRDASAFVEVAKSCRDASLFIDEAAEAVGIGDRAHHWLATASRNHGHAAIFLAQRLTMVAPHVRRNCARVFSFKLHPADAEGLARDMGQPILEAAGLLPRFCCIVAPTFGTPYAMDCRADRRIPLAPETWAGVSSARDPAHSASGNRADDLGRRSAPPEDQPAGIGLDGKPVPGPDARPGSNHGITRADG